MIRKGRPLSDTGRNAAGPRDEDSGSRELSGPADLPDLSHPLHSPNPFDPVDPFDPFESFDAPDRAAGRGPRRAQFQPTQPDQSAEPTYTRSRGSSGSRHSPGPANPDTEHVQGEVKKSQRPARSLKGRALGYLSRREYSRSELARKLKPFVEENDSLDTLEAENWLSDSRFAESLIHRRSSRLGASRIVGELKQHAVDHALVEEASAQLRETELARAGRMAQEVRPASANPGRARQAGAFSRVAGFFGRNHRQDSQGRRRRLERRITRKYSGNGLGDRR
ncbi:MAG: Regulatory protein RecX [uncultured Paraburkholderia sp.]|nr:MAG: Regulatory protein RecX [uncultured Paraburkholderia sp.]CAH2924225.1 MAG: Regulatory protein RecX [uncultured Paraburkholderia sp.]